MLFCCGEMKTLKLALNQPLHFETRLQLEPDDTGRSPRGRLDGAVVDGQ